MPDVSEPVVIYPLLALFMCNVLAENAFIVLTANTCYDKGRVPDMYGLHTDVERGLQ